MGGKDSVTSWLRVGGGTKKPRRAQHGVDDKEQHTTTVVRGGVRGAGWAWAHKRRNADMIFSFHAEKKRTSKQHQLRRREGVVQVRP